MAYARGIPVCMQCEPYQGSQSPSGLRSSDGRRDGTLPGYQANDFLCLYWDCLVRESVLDIKGIKYVLHQGKVRAQGKMCVPLSVMAKVCNATHAFAHPGVDKTVEMVDRRYMFTVPKRQWSDVVSAVVEGCPVCQATKHRRGRQQESNQPYPIPNTLSVVCV